MDDDRFLDDNRLSDMMHRCGIRPSVNRLAVLSFVANRRTHPSADEIFTELQNKFPSLSRTTVYNTLHTLAAAKLLRELEIESGNRHYDLAPAASAQPFHLPQMFKDIRHANPGKSIRQHYPRLHD